MIILMRLQPLEQFLPPLPTGELANIVAATSPDSELELEFQL